MSVSGGEALLVSLCLLFRLRKQANMLLLDMDDNQILLSNIKLVNIFIMNWNYKVEKLLLLGNKCVLLIV